MTRKELISLVVEIRKPEKYSENEHDQLVSLFRNNIPHPEPLNLLFHHVPELEPEEVVERALAYKPILI